ncbi:MAG: substrate-binding domain-containing protein [Nitrospiraceae bacterium]
MRAIAGVMIGLLLGLAVARPAAAGDAAGSMIIVGNGPELTVIEKLARTFEKANPRAYIDVQWDEISKPIELVKSGQAHLAVMGKPDPELKATQVAWDGIAIMVSLSNQTKDITSRQAADLFTGKVKTWAELGGPETKVLILDRPANRNTRDAFEQLLGIAGKIPDHTKVVGPDDKAIKTVAGTLVPNSAVTYVSLVPALEAVASGVAVRLLSVDKVEPEKPPVKDGRYPLRRPVLFLSKKEPNALVDAFEAFALSKEGQKILDDLYTPMDPKS